MAYGARSLQTHKVLDATRTIVEATGMELKAVRLELSETDEARDETGLEKALGSWVSYGMIGDEPSATSASYREATVIGFWL